MPTLPPWHGLHPLVVHLPVALLLVAPLLVVLGIAVRSHRRGILIATCAVMTLGTVGSFVAVATGEAAADAARVGAGIGNAIEEHERLAGTARNLFAGLTALFAILAFPPASLARRLERFPAGALLGALAIVWAAASVVLVNAADRGGRLVHVHGIRADLGEDAAPPSGPDGRAEAARDILERDRAFAERARARDVEGFLEFVAEDAVVFPTDVPAPRAGRDAVREEWEGLLTDPDRAIDWTPLASEGAASGDLGWSWGTWTVLGADGSVAARGKYVTLWRKGDDRVWRVAGDIGAPDASPGDGD